VSGFADHESIEHNVRENGAPPAQSKGLGSTARSAVLWGGTFTFLRDVAQFTVMLVLVRLLSPEDYAIAAIVQAISGVFAIFSFATLSSHALQIRNPEENDWQAHFTAGAMLNSAIAGLVLLLALALSFTSRYREAALPLMALPAVFLMEVPGWLRHRMLEVHHDWKRLRILHIVGIILAAMAGLASALMGGGVWALIVQLPMIGLPSAIDLFVAARFKPDWTWSWTHYRKTVSFALDRAASGLFGRARALNENMLLSSIYDLATLGIFSRANGLATLLAGRIGATAITALYPVVTRAERGSLRFQRLASLILRGVCWTTAPLVAFLAVAAHDTVLLLYGPRWGSVVPLLPFAAAATGIVSVWNALSGLLLANDESRAVLSMEVLAAVSAIALAFVLVPYGARAYLAGLALHALVFVGTTIAVLLRKGAMSASGVAMAIIPAAVAGLTGAVAVLCLHASASADVTILFRIMLDGAILAIVYILTLRIAFSGQLTELLEVIPAGPVLARAMMLPDPRPELAAEPWQP
jgi:O-antigen/teichoic acid export membrane protein